MDRLRTSAGLLGMNYLHTDLALRQVIFSKIQASGVDFCRVCVLIPAEDPDQIMVLQEPFQPLPEVLYQEGVVTALEKFIRDNPEAKSTHFTREREKVAQRHPEVHETLMMNERGQILEGLSSNFYAVKNNVLYTAESGVLKGITRGLLLKAAEDVLPVCFDPVTVENVSAIDEAFLTSSSRGVLPIRQIDHRVIGGGKPGDVTRKLSENFYRIMQQELEPVFP